MTTESEYPKEPFEPLDDGARGSPLTHVGPFLFFPDGENGRLRIEWPNGRPDRFTCTPEMIERLVDVVNAAHEVVTTTEEFNELTGELLSVGPRFVWLTADPAVGDAPVVGGDDYTVAVNVDHIAAVGVRDPAGARVWITAVPAPFGVRESFAEVLALIEDNSE